MVALDPHKVLHLLWVHSGILCRMFTLNKLSIYLLTTNIYVCALILLLTITMTMVIMTPIAAMISEMFIADH